jgi:hypothetical protein
MAKREIYNSIMIGDTRLKKADESVGGEYVVLMGELFYKIQNFDVMQPFFMTIVSSSDHWLFISSTGGLTAGRVSPEQSLFPYYTEDKITENSGNTGNKSILLVRRGNKTFLWEPLSDRHEGNYQILRNIYKNIPGTAVVFEEYNRDLGLTYRYAWRTSDKFGFIKTTWLKNSGKSACRVDILDGIQNILPAGVTVQTQTAFGPLLDAYKRSELDMKTGLAIFALNSNLTDLAEPSESLVATTVAQLGLEPKNFLLSSDQIDHFRNGNGVMTETEIRGRRGAYFVHSVVDLASKKDITWHLIADVDQDNAAIVKKIRELHGDKAALYQEIEKDIASNESNLRKLVGEADGLQLTNNQLSNANHFSNVMFNIMRGGIFADQYWIKKQDLVEYISGRNQTVLQEHTGFFDHLPDTFSITDLLTSAKENGSPDLIRLTSSYLPLTFSRRHGDPSRPWNQFETRIKNSDGSMHLDYQGNWRDIFQNWEALAYSYPEFVESMIFTFLNATTIDGYNPYRITYHGIDWETPQPGNPWANIGYWSDHQIIYLQKLMEISARVHPGRLQNYLEKPFFSCAWVPYQIKPYTDLMKDPFNTIMFNWDQHQAIDARVHEIGIDGKLVHTPNGRVLQVSLAEKLLTLLLAKLANFIPEGGIWMNTQRPEWNDANNALVGKGLSVVTLCYLLRFTTFFKELLNESVVEVFPLNNGIHRFYTRVFETLQNSRDILKSSFDDEDRRKMMDLLGEAGSDYRGDYYKNGISGDTTALPVSDLAGFLNLVQKYIEHSLRANKRSDNLYHSYNILHIMGSKTAVSHLYEMLEGQVAILSSGLLSIEESLVLLQSLRHSPLFQSDQNTYLLYPDRMIPGFLEKNTISPDQVGTIELFPTLIAGGNRSLIIKDINGNYHFSGHIRNARDVTQALEIIKSDPTFTHLVENESERIHTLFEATFHHNEFTGRSGTFFAYEGLGSVYWHMITKLLLAVQETIMRNRDGKSTKPLIEKYNEIREGLNFTKSPELYGAFPTDPYSHTPKGQGAKQPGMTGSVKEEILTRLGELGLRIENGEIVFDPFLLDPKEFLINPASFCYQDVNGQEQSIELEIGSLVCMFCQTPIVLQKSTEQGITIFYTTGKSKHIKGNFLDTENSAHIFRRDASIHQLTVSVIPADKRK